MLKQGDGSLSLLWRKPMKNAAIIAAAALPLAGCVADYVKGNSSPVNLYVVSVNGGNALRSSVRFPVTPDVVNVAVANRTKNPLVDISSRVAMAIVIERYEVRYFRSDGKNVEGQDVPYRVSGNITTGFDVESSGTADIPVTVVRAQAKVEPPLTGLRGEAGAENNQGGATGGQAFVLTVFAEITIHGRTLAGEAVSGTGRLQIDFADWPTTS
jgi:hypothetical protein